MEGFDDAALAESARRINNLMIWYFMGGTFEPPTVIVTKEVDGKCTARIEN